MIKKNKEMQGQLNEGFNWQSRCTNIFPKLTLEIAARFKFNVQETEYLALALNEAAAQQRVREAWRMSPDQPAVERFLDREIIGNISRLAKRVRDNTNNFRASKIAISKKMIAGGGSAQVSTPAKIEQTKIEQVDSLVKMIGIVDQWFDFSVALDDVLAQLKSNGTEEPRGTDRLQGHTTAPSAWPPRLGNEPDLGSMQHLVGRVLPKLYTQMTEDSGIIEINQERESQRTEGIWFIQKSYQAMKLGLINPETIKSHMGPKRNR